MKELESDKKEEKVKEEKEEEEKEEVKNNNNNKKEGAGRWRKRIRIWTRNLDSESKKVQSIKKIVAGWKSSVWRAILY